LFGSLTLYGIFIRLQPANEWVEYTNNIYPVRQTQAVLRVVSVLDPTIKLYAWTARSVSE